MIKKLKKAVSIFLAAVMILSVMPATVLAAQSVSRDVPFGDVAAVPAAFWPIRNAYESAYNAGDINGRIYHGERIVNFWLDGQTARQRAEQWGANVAAHGFQINDVWSFSSRTSGFAEQQGNTEVMLRMSRVAIEFADVYVALAAVTPALAHVDPAGIAFARRLHENRIAAFDVSAQLFVELRDGSGETSHFGVLHEPRTGVFFGEPADSALNIFNKRAAATLIYAEFENRDLPQVMEYKLRRLEAQGTSRNDLAMVQVAWNFLREGATLASVPNERAMVTEVARYLRSTDLPIILRIGAEMDVWSVPADPQEFINAYRFIARIMRAEAPNVALMWSVNFISAADRNWQMFYPGQAYVDWVGISLYSHRYFMGNPNTTDTDAQIWRTGRFANPISFVRDLVEQFGDRHPILIAEGAPTIRNLSNNEDTTDWAMPIMRQMYSYIPMLFPQVKGIFWFNVDPQVLIAGQPGRQVPHSFYLNHSPRARALYGELISGENFLGVGHLESPITFRRLGTATMPADNVVLLTYAPFFMHDNVVVTYSIGGREVGRSSVIPYRVPLNLSGEQNGRHTLTVRVLSGTQVLYTAQYNIYKNHRNVTISSAHIATAPAPGVTVVMDGEVLTFDMPPQLIGGSTMVPLRAIFERMGAEVDWYDPTQTVTATKGDTVVVLTIGDPYPTVNGVVWPLPQPAVLMSGRTLAPMRFVAEAFGGTVDWIHETQTATIQTE